MNAAHPRFFYGWVIVAVILAMNVAANATASFSFGLFVLPMSDDLGVTRGLIGWIPTARLAGTAVSSFFLGRAVDRFGSRILIPAASVIAALALIGVSRANEFAFVLVLFAVLGLVDISTPGNVLTAVPIAKWFVRFRGRATAIGMLGIAGGGVIFPLVHQWLIDTSGWRMALAVSSFILVAFALPLPLIFLRRQPEDMGLRPDGAPSDGFPNSEEIDSLQTDTAETMDDEEQWTLRDALRTPTLWKVAFAYATINFAAIGFIVHRAGYWSEAGFGSGLIALGFSIDSVGFAGSAMVAGLLIERVPARFVGALAATGQMTALLLALVWVASPVVIISPLLFGLSSGAGVVVQTVIWADYYGRKHQGSVRGFVLPITLIGMGLGPPMIGTLYDVTGGSYLIGFWLAVGLIACAAVVLLTATPPRKSRASKAVDLGV